MNEILYCLGIAMTPDRKWVALIEKKKGPEYNIGKLNGIGGKIEQGENPNHAMAREFGDEPISVIEIELLHRNELCSSMQWIIPFAASSNPTFIGLNVISSN